MDATVAWRPGSCCASEQSVLRHGIFPATTSDKCCAAGTTAHETPEVAMTAPSATAVVMTSPMAKAPRSLHAVAGSRDVPILDMTEFRSPSPYKASR